MRAFILQRQQDVSGVSGIGAVAEGVCFHDGTVVIKWLAKPSGLSIYSSPEAAIAIHGHEGRTTIQWLDSAGHNLPTPGKARGYVAQ